MPDRWSKYLKGDGTPWMKPGDFRGLVLPRPIALINGAFDVLHSGHMKLISVARRDSKTLVCAIDGDEKCRRKGKGRPIQTWVERAVTMSYMPVDFIVKIEGEEDMRELIEALKPDFRVLGREYKGAPTRFPFIPRYFVANRGMRTSTIERRILKAYGVDCR